MNYRCLASYKSRVGSVVSHFFWYLAEVEIIDLTTAENLLGYTFLSDNVDPQDRLLRYFVEGVRTHLYADIKAHDPVNGYVEGVDMWIDTLTNKIGNTDRMAFHGAVELAADSHN